MSFELQIIYKNDTVTPDADEKKNSQAQRASIDIEVEPRTSATKEAFFKDG